jgi:hypothetical protein
MSSHEFPEILKSQAEACFELAAKLREKLLGRWEEGELERELINDDDVEAFHEMIRGLKKIDKLNIEVEKLEEIEPEYGLLFPFNSFINNLDRKKQWLASLQFPKGRSDSFTGTVYLYQAPIDDFGNFKTERKNLIFYIGPETRNIGCTELNIQRLMSAKDATVNDDLIDIFNLTVPDSNQATDIRILLEDALAQID